MTSSPSCSPWRLCRRLAGPLFLAAVAALVLLATRGTVCAQVTGEESEGGARMLDRLKTAFAEGAYKRVAEDLRNLRSVSTSAIVPETHLGIRLALRKIVYSWNGEQREQYQRLVGDDSRKALAAAGAGLDAVERVFIDFPGTEVARQACLRLGSTALEDGDLARSALWLRLYLDDTQTPPPARPKVAVMLVLALAMQGLQAEASAALDEALKGLQDDPADYWGTQCSAREMGQRILKIPQAPLPTWPQVGGQATRCNLVPTEVQAQECLALGGQSIVAGFDVAVDEVLGRGELLNSPVRSGLNYSAEEASVTTQRYLVTTCLGQLGVYDLRTRALLWRQPVGCPGLEGLVGLWPACDERSVVLLEPRLRSTVENARTALQAGQGACWRTVRNVVTARDLETGRLLWQWEGTPVEDAAGPAVGGRPEGAPPKAPRKQSTESSPVVLEEGLEPAGAPLIHGRRIYLPVTRVPKTIEYNVPDLIDCFVVCLDATTGRLLWVQYLASGGGGDFLGIAATLAPDRLGASTDGRRLYVTAGLGAVAALDLAAGEVAWITTLPLADNPNPRGRREIMAAPILCGDRLIVSDWRISSTLRALSTAAGRLLWQQEVPTKAALCLQGAADGRVLVTAADKAWAYDLANGEKRFETTLPAPATGRGFLSGTAAIVPTAAGLVRLDAAGQATVLRALAPREPPPVLAIPLNSGLVIKHRTGLALCGSRQAMVDDLERLEKAWPDLIEYKLQLAALRLPQHRQGDAEALLTAACRLKNPAGDAAASRRDRVRSAVKLCELRSQSPDNQARGEALTLLEQAVSEAAGLPIEAAGRMTLGRQFESLGDKARAVQAYRRAAANAAAGLMMEDVDPKESSQRSLAAVAESRLAALGASSVLSTQRPQSADDVDRIQVFTLGEVDLRTPELDEAPRVLLSRTSTAVPVLWLGDSSVTALGSRGQILWRRSVAESDGFRAGGARHDPLVTMATTQLVQAYRASDGEPAWQWRPDQGEVIVWHQSLSVYEPPGKDGQAIPVALVVTQTGGPLGQHHGLVLDWASGKLLWRVDLPMGQSIAAALSGNTLAITGASRGSMCHTLAIDLATGKELWRQDGLSANYRPHLLPGNGLVLLTGNASTQALDLAKGTSLWQIDSEKHGWPVDIVAVNDETTVLVGKQGYVAFDTHSGKEKWKIPAVAASLQRGGGSRPAALSGNTLVARTGQQIGGYDLADGQKLWEHAILDTSGAMQVISADGDVVAASAVSGEAVVTFLDVRTGKLLGGKKLDRPPSEKAGLTQITPTVVGWYLALDKASLMLTVPVGSAEGGSPSNPAPAAPAAPAAGD